MNFNLLIILMTLFNNIMVSPQLNSSTYKVITTEEGIAYLNQHKIKASEWSPEHLLPNRAVYVYPLSTGEIVLLEAGLCDGRPAFVFSNKNELQRCLNDDFFPVPLAQMTWLEENAKQVEHFLDDSNFYLKPIHEALGVTVPFRTIGDCEVAYEKLRIYVRRKSTSIEDHVSMNHYFALAMGGFLVREKGYLYTIDKIYNGYNPENRVFLIEKESGTSQRKDLFSATFRAVESKWKASFRTFYWYVTGIPPVSVID